MLRTILLTLSLLAFALPPGASAQDTAASDYQAVTSTIEPIELKQLDVLLVPLTADELQIEAKAWQQRLQTTASRISQLEVNAMPLAELDEDELSDAQAAEKQQISAELKRLRARRADEVSATDLVLDHITEKVGLTETHLEPELVLNMRRYVDAVDGIRTNSLEKGSQLDEFKSWVVSPEGGKRLLTHIAKLLGWAIGFWALGHLLARLISKGLTVANRNSRMLESFLRRNLPKAGFILGVLSGLAMLGVSITPILAVIGGLSFVVAFALQDSLSNFASGIMIMMYKPFDVDDVVDVADVQGTIKSMTLVSTTINTFDNQMMIVPNNTIWQNIITNVTGSTERRVDLIFGIGYEDDMDKTQNILQELVKAHPLTLDDPKPLIHVHELGDSSVNFICRPWVKTADYWTVYWDLTRQVKERFDQEGISIPFPQRDVHIKRDD